MNNNEDLVKKMIDTVWKKKNVEACSDFFHPTVIFHRHHDEIKGVENVKKFIKDIFTAFPDYDPKILDMFTKDNKVCIHWESKGTHKGNFLGNSPTNKKIQYEGFTVYTIESGKIKEGWILADLFGILKQIGVLNTAAAKR